MEAIVIEMNAYLSNFVEYINTQVFGIEGLITEKNEKNTKIQSRFSPDLGEFLKSRGFF